MKLHELLPEEAPDSMRVYVCPMHGERVVGELTALRIPRGGLEEQAVREYLCFRVGLLGVGRKSEKDGALSVLVLDAEAQTELARLHCADGPPRQPRAWLNVSSALTPEDPGIAGLLAHSSPMSVNTKALDVPEVRNMLFYSAGYLCRKTWRRAENHHSHKLRPVRIWLDGFRRKVFELYSLETCNGR